jgi:hypothetical protein
MIEPENVSRLNLSAEIIPGRSLGGFRVGTLLRDIGEWIAAEALRDQVTYEMIGLFEASYRLAGGAVELVVDIRVGKVARITASEGYEGALNGLIRPGMPVGEAMLADPTLYYSEEEELILRRGTPGIALRLSESDPDPATVDDLTVIAISVFTEAIDTAAGQRGSW